MLNCNRLRGIGNGVVRGSSKRFKTVWTMLFLHAAGFVYFLFIYVAPPRPYQPILARPTRRVFRYTLKPTYFQKPPRFEPCHRTSKDAALAGYHHQCLLIAESELLSWPKIYDGVLIWPCVIGANVVQSKNLTSAQEPFPEETRNSFRERSLSSDSRYWGPSN